MHWQQKIGKVQKKHLLYNELFGIILKNNKEKEEKYLWQTYHLLQKYMYHLRDVLFQGIHGQMKGGEYDEID